MGEAETLTAETTAKPKRRGRPKGSEVPALHQSIVEAHQSVAGISNREVARNLGVNQHTVAEVLAKYRIKKKDLDVFKENRADVYAGTIQRIVASIDASCIENASLRDRATAAGILQDKERLERGQSTANVANLHSIAERAIRSISSTVNPPAADQGAPEGVYVDSPHQ